MNSYNIYHYRNEGQGQREGIKAMNGIYFTRAIHSAIREHGEYKDGSYRLCARSLPVHEKKSLFLYLADQEEYEFACTSDMAANAVFEEHREAIQSAIDGECFEVYKEDMEEMGVRMAQDSVNGEIYWVKR